MGGSNKIYVGDGTGLRISHIGDASLTTSSGNFELKDVLFVPDIKKNLISVSPLTYNNSCIFEFSSEKFLIKDRRTGWILATESRMGGLYALDKGEQALVALKFGKAPEGVWHQRLGHPQ